MTYHFVLETIIDPERPVTRSMGNPGEIRSSFQFCSAILKVVLLCALNIFIKPTVLSSIPNQIQSTTVQFGRGLVKIFHNEFYGENIDIVQQKV